MYAIRSYYDIRARPEGKWFHFRNSGEAHALPMNFTDGALESNCETGADWLEYDPCARRRGVEQGPAAASR